MARLYRRPDLCRRHPRPARSQRPPHRSRRRQLEAQAAQINPKGLTADTQLAKNLSLAEARQPGDIISYRRATSSRNQRATSSESAIISAEVGADIIYDVARGYEPSFNDDILEIFAASPQEDAGEQPPS